MIGIGCDIVKIKRIEQALNRFGERLSQKILSETEIDHYSRSKFQVAYLAKRFAAKEAVVKALGTGVQYGIRLKDITIQTNLSGAPEVVLSGGAKIRFNTLGASKIAISIADEQDYAVAYAHIA